MSEQVLPFGEQADVYEDTRPGYPDALVRTVLDYARPLAGPVVEVGAGTGKATEAFVRGLTPDGVPVRCVEPDPRRAAVLRGRLPVEVDVVRFEDWAPPAGGVGLLYCAQAWHWMDERLRCALAHGALAPSGTVALFSHAYLHTDPAVEAAQRRVYEAHAPELLTTIRARVPDEPPGDNWLTVELAGCGLFADVRAHRFVTTVDYSSARYRRLVGTFSPVSRVPADRRARLLTGLAEVVDAWGGTVGVRLDTTLALGRRPA